MALDLDDRSAAGRSTDHSSLPGRHVVRKSLERTVALWFALVALISVVLGLFTLGAVNASSTNDRRVEHTHVVLRMLERANSLLREAESSGRGFVVSGKPHLLEPFERALPEVEQELQSLGRSIADNPVQLRRLAELREVVARKVELMRRVIRVRREQGFDAVLEMIRDEQGLKLMDRIRGLVAAMSADEQSLLDRRAREAKAGRERAMFALSLGMGANLIILSMVFRMIGREAVRRGLAEEALHAGAAEAKKLAMVASKTHNGVVIVDDRGRIDWVNEAFTRITGYQPEEALGRVSREFLLGPETDQAIVDRLREVVWGGRTMRVEMLQYAKGGRRYWADVEAQPIVGPLGTVTNVIGIFSDITERRRSEGRLVVQHAAMKILAEAPSLARAIPELLRAIGENLHVDVAEYWTIDPSANVLRMADHWASDPRFDARFSGPSRLWAFAKGVGLPGRIWAAGEPSWIDDLAHDPNFLRSEIAGRVGLRHGFGFPIVNASGTVGVVTLLARDRQPTDEPLLGVMAALGGQVGQFVERREGEVALRESEERFRALADSAPVMIWLGDSCGDRTWFSRGWLDFTGRPLGREVGRGWVENVHLGDLGRLLDIYQDAYERRVEYQVEFRLRRSDGEYRWVLGKGVPRWLADGSLGGYIGSCLDVTDFRNAREAAVSASRSKSEFLANMSHEIRTPINGILGMTELALETSLTRLQREYLGMVRSSADALLTVINDILDFSKIEAGKLDLERAPFRLRESLDDTICTLAQRAHAKELELACRIAPDVPDALVGDPGRLRQVLVNLIGNAIKFTGRGEVVISVEAGPPVDGEVVLRFSVADTGVGIPEDKRRAIFEPFEQADGSTTRKYGGTGLGLSISSKLVALMEGRIGVEGEVGVGSTFRFTAKFGLGPGEDGPGRADVPGRMEGLRVLVVDDNHTNRRILEEVLNNWGARPSTAVGGVEALEALRAAKGQGRPFDVALIDGMMPGMDGFDLASRIGASADFPHPLLIMLTSGGLSGENARALALGISGYLTKPVRQSELFDVMMKILEAAGSPAPEGTMTRPPEIPAEPAGKSQSLRILLAEDHVVNQKVALAMLQGMGHDTSVVPDGRKAVEAWRSGRFDLILMDLQMPEMDGFEAVASIRALERPRAGRIPIVALTAHAMKGDRERCLAAGFDDYLTKPIRSAQLREALEKWSGRLAVGPDRSPPGPIGPSGTEFDRDSALATVGGDAGLLGEVVGLFLGDCPRLLTEIERAIDRSDAPDLKRLAHTVRGVAGNFALPAVVEAARVLESRAGDQAWETIREDFDELREGLERVRPALEAVAASSP